MNILMIDTSGPACGVAIMRDGRLIYEAELVNQQLYVWVRGNSDLVADLDPGQLQVEVDLSDASTGSELQRFAATVTFKGDNPEGVGIMGTQYSVAVRLHPTS